MESEIKRLNSTILDCQKNQLILPTIKPTKAQIAHFGVGVFHRGHQALYTLKAMEATKDDAWGILGIGIMPFDKKLQTILNEQDCLYTLTEKSADNKIQLKLINSITGYLFGPENLELVTEKVASENIQVITMTITEGGYFINKDTGQFDITNQKIVHQIKNWDKEAPSIIYGYLTRIIERRMKTHGKGVTILSCDNIQHNGDYLAKGFLSFLIKANPQMLTWVKQNCTFPNSMVDRITPQSAQKDIDFITQKFQILDLAPVISEDFLQWIIEDKFINKRPPWDVSGAQFVKDVTPYEKMKLRVLNASHQALCYAGILHGYKYVHQAAKDPTISEFVTRYVQEQVLQTLDPVPGINLQQYYKDVMHRFSNEAVLDTLSRICEFTSDRIPLFNVPTMLEMIKKKKSIPKSAMIIGTWIVFAEEYFKDNNIFNLVDNRKKQVLDAVELIMKGQKASSFLKLPGMFGSLNSNQQFCQLLNNAYKSLKSQNCIQALKQAL